MLPININSSVLERETEREWRKKKSGGTRRSRFPDSALLFVPETGFEPARRFQRHHLKVVRLPISPPGHPVKGAKNRFLFF